MAQLLRFFIHPETIFPPLYVLLLFSICFGLQHAYDGVFSKVWSKSGSIVCDLIGDRLVASKINGKYWMYWGMNHSLLLKPQNSILNSAVYLYRRK